MTWSVTCIPAGSWNRGWSCAVSTVRTDDFLRECFLMPWDHKWLQAHLISLHEITSNDRKACAEDFQLRCNASSVMPAISLSTKRACPIKNTCAILSQWVPFLYKTPRAAFISAGRLWLLTKMFFFSRFLSLRARKSLRLRPCPPLRGHFLFLQMWLFLYGLAFCPHRTDF